MPKTIKVNGGSNSHYESDFGFLKAFGAGKTKIAFLKARLRQAFKKANS